MHLPPTDWMLTAATVLRGNRNRGPVPAYVGDSSRTTDWAAFPICDLQHLAVRYNIKLLGRSGQMPTQPACEKTLPNRDDVVFLDDGRRAELPGFDPYFARWIQQLRERQRSPSTVSTYAQALPPCIATLRSIVGTDVTVRTISVEIASNPRNALSCCRFSGRPVRLIGYAEHRVET